MGFVFLRHRVHTGRGAHPASCPMGNGVLTREVKRPGREADLSPPSVEVNAWSYITTPPVRLHDMVLN
jgi:hypothetical protein